ncbi:DUF1010 domain-containing protein [Escherichia coli]|uniref:DUF1010 domain-containing protein n=1 Tax=Escherichia coli TaxID=562 RepID=UPI00374CC8A1
MRLRKYNKSLGWLSLFAGTVLLSGCNSALLDPKGQIGLEQRSLILTAFGLMLIVVIPAILMAVGFAWKYRASNKDAKYSPNWSHSNKVEAVVWTVPILIIIFLAVLTVAKFKLSVLASGSNISVKPTRILRSAYLAR